LHDCTVFLVKHRELGVILVSL